MGKKNGFESNISKSFGVAGFVLGLLSVVFVLVFFLSLPMAILGLIFSIIQIRRNKTGLAVTGLVLSIVGLLGSLSIIVLIITGIYSSVWLSEVDIKTEDSIVLVTYDFEYKTPDGKMFRDSSGGSGVIFSNENDLLRVITNRHVVDCEYSRLCNQRVSENFKIVTNDGKNIVADKVHISPYNLDIAILDFKTQGEEYTVAPISKEIEEGERVVAIGYTSFSAATREFSKGAGVISGFREIITEEGHKFKVIDSSAYTFYGSSGGGLFNEDGSLIGLTTWLEEWGSSFAISSESFPDFGSFITCEDGYVTNNRCAEYCRWILNEQLECVGPCTDFYCETEERSGRDDRCPDSMILGQDNSCHKPCGSNRGYCPMVTDICYQDKCVSCPQGYRLYKDGSCYP